MNILVTGASGWHRPAVVPELLGAGHEVVGLARPRSRRNVWRPPAHSVWRGDVDDPERPGRGRRPLRRGDPSGVPASRSPGEWDFARLRRRPTGGPSRPWGRPWPTPIGPSSSPQASSGWPRGRFATEGDGLVPSAEVRANPAVDGSRHRPAGAVPEGHRVRSSVLLRLPPTVHGDGDHGIHGRPGRHGPPTGRIRLPGRRDRIAGRRCTAPMPPA